jgi:Putative sensor
MTPLSGRGGGGKKPCILAAVRGLADRVRRLAGEWRGVDIGIPSLRQPGSGDADGSGLRRLGWLLTDPATWRDLLWLTVDSTVAGVIVLVPAGQSCGGCRGSSCRLCGSPSPTPAEATGMR